MNLRKYVFSQIFTIQSICNFNRCVNSFKGDKRIEHFTYWYQMMYMTFGQLSNCDSIRNLLVCLDAHKAKQYHLGFDKNISK